MEILLAVFCAIFPFAAGAEIIAHLVDWRFDDVAKECEINLQKTGYAAVLVSPVHEPPDMKKMPWFERYQVYSYNVTTRSGNSSDLIRMTEQCHKVGIKVYAEVVLNHMTDNFLNYKLGVGGSTANPNSKDYPALSFTSEHFHPTCEIVDYLNASNVRMCEYDLRHDLYQKHEHVRGKQVEFLDQLVDLGVDGFKICHAKYMFPDDLEIILARVKNLPSDRRPFVYLDIDSTGGGGSMPQDYLKLGPVTEYGFQQFMTNSNLIKFEHYLATHNTKLIESNKSVVFMNLMDSRREWDIGLRKFRVFNAFMLAQPYGAYKVIMSSYRMSLLDRAPPHYGNRTIKHVEFLDGIWCKHPWNCEHRDPIVSKMIQFSKIVEGSNMTHFAVHGAMNKTQISFCRDRKGFVALSDSVYSTASIRVQTCLPEGRYCNIASGSYINKQGKNTCYARETIVDKDGMALVTFTPQEDGIIALHIQDVANNRAAKSSATSLTTAAYLLFTIIVGSHLSW